MPVSCLALLIGLLLSLCASVGVGSAEAKGAGRLTLSASRSLIPPEGSDVTFTGRLTYRKTGKPIGRRRVEIHQANALRSTTETRYRVRTRRNGRFKLRLRLTTFDSFHAIINGFAASHFINVRQQAFVKDVKLLTNPPISLDLTKPNAYTTSARGGLPAMTGRVEPASAILPDFQGQAQPKPIGFSFTSNGKPSIELPKVSWAPDGTFTLAATPPLDSARAVPFVYPLVVTPTWRQRCVPVDCYVHSTLMPLVVTPAS